MMSRAGQAVKRGIDAAGALLGLILLSPVLLVTSCLILLEDGRPVLFRQQRIGRGGRPFELIKFRSMRVNDVPVAEFCHVDLERHPLTTRVGRWMRRSKVDELPQLLCVVRGEMSLVGPRPTVAEQVAEYDEFERRRLQVRPGLSGWAQVNGSRHLEWPERIMLDVWYVDHWSLGLDLRIVARTVGVVVRGEHPAPAALATAAAHARVLRSTP